MKTVKGAFVHLHLHSQYSLLDGAIRFPQLFDRLSASGVNSVALTDHGNMYGAVDFYRQAKAYGIHPVIGCEVYVAPESRLIKKKISRRDTSNHLVLLAKNRAGYQNLIRLVSLAFMEGFYYKPRIDHELLEKYHEGLIALSACLKGEVPSLILNNQTDDARERLRYYKGLFGEGNFYIEVQKNGIPEQDKVNDVILEMARDTGIPPVATNDCHYLEREDAKAHEVLLCLQTGKTLADTSRMKFQTNEFYVKTPEEMIAAFPDVPEAIESTLEIAEKCDVNLDFEGYHFPAITMQKDLDHETYLKKMAEEGLEAYFKKRETQGKPVDEAAYRQRLHYELETIVEMGFADYFLIVSDFIGYARKNNIPVGPGRGSAAGSLVSFSLGITEIDPIPYKLMFERFLAPGRVSMPDIDCDFSDEKREQVIQYVAEKYGHDRVAQITTFSAMRAKAVVRDVGRVMGLPYGEVDRVAKLIPDTIKITLEEAFDQEPKLHEAVNSDPKIAELFRVARTLEGLNRHNSTHAAGVVISGKPLMELLPLCLGKKDEILTQYDMTCVESVGLVKFDFLGLSTLSLIDRAVELIKAVKDADFDIKSIPLDDKKTFALLRKGYVGGVFQLENAGMRDLLIRMKPKKFEDLIDLLALFRPGPLQSGMVEDYIKRKNNSKKITYDIDQLKDILGDSYGVILYQEQVMQIVMKLAGFSPSDADRLRKAMGKKKAEEMANLREKFIEGAAKNNIPSEKAAHLYDQMAQFAKYGFNKSHSTAYALITYQTAFLKAHYPTEFMAALMSVEMGDADKLARYIDEARGMGIEVQPPDVNKSGLDFTVEGEKICFGLAGVKNVGQGAAQLIEEERKNKGAFSSILDFCSRLDLRKVNKRVLESLIKCGAFDTMGISRARLFAALDEILSISQREQKQRKSRQKSLFGEGDGVSNGGLSEDYVYPDVEEWPQSKRLLYEKELLGMFLTGHPLMAFEDKLKTLGVTAIGEITRKLNRKTVKIAGIVVVSKEITTKKGNEKMAFVTVEDHTGTIEVLVFPSVFKTVSVHLLPDTPLLVEGTVDMSGGDMAKIKAASIMPLEDAKEVKPIHVHISADKINSENIFAFKHLLEECRGQNPVYMHLTIEATKEAVIALPEHLCGLDTPEFLGSVGNIFGETSRVEV